MSPDLRAFIAQHCHKHPSCSVGVKSFAAAFKSSLPPNKRAAWPRTRIVQEITAAGYRIGSIEKRHSVAGLSLGTFEEDNGALVLVS